MAKPIADGAPISSLLTPSCSGRGQASTPLVIAGFFEGLIVWRSAMPFPLHNRPRHRVSWPVGARLRVSSVEALYVLKVCTDDEVLGDTHNFPPVKDRDVIGLRNIAHSRKNILTQSFNRVRPGAENSGCSVTLDPFPIKEL